VDVLLAYANPKNEGIVVWGVPQGRARADAKLLRDLAEQMEAFDNELDGAIAFMVQRRAALREGEPE
jgi:hypothetical protein